MNVREPSKSILVLRFLRTSYNSRSLGCPGILKSSTGTDVISKRQKSTYLCLGTASLLVTETFKFKNFKFKVTSSYLQYWACSQILAFLTAWSLWFVLLCFGSFWFILSLRILVQPKYLNICFSQL